ncbi:MAG: hypothetical protein ACI9PP_000771 [Halobacteriales archaeon]
MHVRDNERTAVQNLLRTELDALILDRENALERELFGPGEPGTLFREPGQCCSHAVVNGRGKQVATGPPVAGRHSTTDVFHWAELRLDGHNPVASTLSTFPVQHRLERFQNGVAKAPSD